MDPAAGCTPGRGTARLRPSVRDSPAAGGRSNSRIKPEFRAIYLKYDEAFDWSPEDRRLYALAARSERWFSKRHVSSKGSERSVLDSTLAQLVTTSVGMSSPAWDRLTEIARERKATGSER
jgi:hypothetical protein